MPKKSITWMSNIRPGDGEGADGAEHEDDRHQLLARHREHLQERPGQEQPQDEHRDRRHEDHGHHLEDEVRRLDHDERPRPDAVDEHRRQQHRRRRRARHRQGQDRDHRARHRGVVSGLRGDQPLGRPLAERAPARDWRAGRRHRTSTRPCPRPRREGGPSGCRSARSGRWCACSARSRTASG